MRGDARIGKTEGRRRLTNACGRPSRVKADGAVRKAAVSIALSFHVEHHTQLHTYERNDVRILEEIR